jgi:hypothetical protein
MFRLLITNDSNISCEIGDNFSFLNAHNWTLFQVFGFHVFIWSLKNKQQLTVEFWTRNHVIGFFWDYYFSKPTVLLRLKTEGVV